MMYGYYGPHTGAGPWLAMGLMNLGIWVLLIALVVWVIRSVAPHNMHRHGRDDPMEVLAQRFARGEIDAEEYLARRRVLEGREP